MKTHYAKSSIEQIENEVTNLRQMAAEAIDRYIRSVLSGERWYKQKPTWRMNFMYVTRRLRWWIADHVAPDIHEFCD